jgi:uncharacterized surface protein with fasciclin (FAS1) repeats
LKTDTAQDLCLCRLAAKAESRVVAVNSAPENRSIRNYMKNLLERITDNPSLTTLREIIQQSELNEQLSGDHVWTLFAPNNQAFAELSAMTMESLRQDKATLRTLLNYHLVEDELWMSTLYEIDFLRTSQGDELRIDNRDEIQVNNARIIQPDIECSNGLIHIINTVLLQISTVA